MASVQGCGPSPKRREGGKGNLDQDTTREPGSLTHPENDALEDHAYFLAIEDHFVRLRGAPLLLSPADWQVARRWHRQGIPLELVRRALEEVFARRRERGAKGRISSLRYCAPAVEAAWTEHSELAAPGARVEAEAFDAASRLAALAAALPEAPRLAMGPLVLAGVRAELAALAGSGLDPQAIEERLAELDRRTLDGALAALGAAERAALDATLDKTIGAVAGRLAAAEIELARGRLARQVLRERLGLPMLSLFSPEARPPEAAANPEPPAAAGERSSEP
jgi:hypothetical protein